MGKPRMEWGGWKLRPEAMTLVLERDGEWKYEIRLEECGTSAEVLDWIFQVYGKPWLTSEEMLDLLKAISDIIDPQGNLCSGGTDHTINPDEHVKQYLKSDPERFQKRIRGLMERDEDEE